MSHLTLVQVDFMVDVIPKSDDACLNEVQCWFRLPSAQPANTTEARAVVLLVSRMNGSSPFLGRLDGLCFPSSGAGCFMLLPRFE